MKTAIMLETKAILLPKSAIPRMARDVFKSGTKHRKISINAVNIVYTTTPNLPLLATIFLIVFMFVKLNAFKIKYIKIDIAAKDKTTKRIFNHFFIVHNMWLCEKVWMNIFK